MALCASNVPDTAETREHLRESGPIGCRDWHTVRWCESRDLACYFASCPSCLLERDFDGDGTGGAYDPGGPIVLVDVNPKRLPPFGISDRPFLCLTNRVRPGEYPDAAARFAALKRRLRVLRSASLVITNRLHVAMPCLGMGVPVVMVEADSLAFRLTALPPWLKIHRKEELKRIALDPAQHATAEWRENRTAWREQVARSLGERLGLV
ncbi:MAG: polysaccharide pyruvyl transferase family protein [Verrucomicrobiae bacterium]|nr:polysaccharide pyruvyl transferase family protein [Verrucomicrobiae bacterium]